jgi:hypothetical protein
MMNRAAGASRRAAEHKARNDAMNGFITRDNVDALLDSGRLEVAMHNGNWWKLRRNGQTKKWARDASRIRIPLKMGFRGTTDVDESHFGYGPNGDALNPSHFRIAE